jgi:hypothetical protein
MKVFAKDGKFYLTGMKSEVQAVIDGLSRTSAIYDPNHPDHPHRKGESDEEYVSRLSPHLMGDLEEGTGFIVEHARYDSASRKNDWHEFFEHGRSFATPQEAHAALSKRLRDDPIVRHLTFRIRPNTPGGRPLFTFAPHYTPRRVVYPNWDNQ